MAETGFGAVTPSSRLARGLGWLGSLAVALVVLERSGRGSLTGPPLGQPARWSSWLAGRDPLTAAFAIVRLGALGLVGYLVAATTLGLVLRLAGATPLVALADRFTVPPLRRLLAGTVSLGLASSAMVAGVGITAVTAGRPLAAVAATQAAPSSTTAPPATVTMHRLPAAGAEIVPAAGPGPPAVVPATSAAPPERWTVRPGDCFWSIAEAVLQQAWGHAPTDAEIVPYWRRLIEANRPALAHPGDPDLIFPAQVFQIPAP